MLQHLTYLDPFVKAEVASFNVSHHLIAMLANHHRNPHIPRIFPLSILGALRNLCSGADSTARRAITAPESNLLAVILDVIGAHQAVEEHETAVRELATAVLWNISVDSEVVCRLTEDGVLDVISRAIILPSIQFATKPMYNSNHQWAGWCTDFKNSTGILRNCTSQLSQAASLVAGALGVAPLRLLLESFTVAVRFSVTQQDTESKSVENIVCFLQNITAAISNEANRAAGMKRTASTPNVANIDAENDVHTSSGLGCALVGSQWCLSRHNNNNRTATMVAAGRGGLNGQGQGRNFQNDPNDIKQLLSSTCARSLVEALLPLLADCSNPTTLEAGLGTIRNLVSIASLPLKLRDFKSSQQSLIAEPGCCDVARDAVWRHGGLPIIVDLLAITSDGVLRSAASALAALGTSSVGTADTDGVLVIRELIGKQALDRLVRKLPTPNDATLTDAFASDSAICAILAAVLVIVRPFSQQQQAAFHQQIMTPSSPAAFALHAVSDLNLVQRMHFLVRPERYGLAQLQFDGQVKRLAQAVLATLWQHNELRPAFSRLGFERAAFFVATGPNLSVSSATLPNRSGNISLLQNPQRYLHGNYPSDHYLSQSYMQQRPVSVGVYGGDPRTMIINGMVVEERLIDGPVPPPPPAPPSAPPSVATISTGSIRDESTADLNSAARIETRRGSSSSSWATHSLANNNTAPVVLVPSPTDSVSAHHESEAANNENTNKTVAEAIGAINNSGQEAENDDDEMFALSQLGPSFIVDEESEQYVRENGHSYPNNKNDGDDDTTQQQGSASSNDNNSPTQEKQQSRPISVNKDLFMLALNCNAPDSWV